MIRIRRARLPDGLQALACRDHGAVVVYVSAALSASERAAAIRRALRAAPEAGWRSPRSPVLLPALAGGAGLPLAPGGRWAYRALFAAAAAAVIAVVTVLVLAGGSPGHGPAHSSAALRPAASPAGPAATSGPGPTPGRPATRVQAGQPATAGAPAPETSGKPTPVPTVTVSPAPRPSPTTSRPSPSPSPSSASNPSGPGCVDVLGVRICL